MVFYRRRLPHWQPDGKSYFVTWRLHGSLPARLKTGNGSSPTKKVGVLSDSDFLARDSTLDQARTGPLWLRDPRVAAMVVEALHFGGQTLQLFSMSAFVVMPNHIHVLWTPRTRLEAITRRLKGYTSLNANRILGRAGQRFWQDESFDHWIRSDGEFDGIISYIEENPVKAELANNARDWKWSSAWQKRQAGPVCGLPQLL